MKQQQSTALFTTEAEIYAGSLAACEGIFLRNSYSDLGVPLTEPTLLRLDNSGAVTLAHDPVLHSRSKHIARREFHIRELIDNGDLKVSWVKSENNRADSLTKPLPRAPFQRHRAILLGY